VGDTVFEVRTSGFNDRSATAGPRYIQQAWLNGTPLDAAWLSARELHEGGELHLQVGPHPSKWATDNRPPSFPAPNNSARPPAQPA
jgi:putative alpha-1,2-mannosidase